MKPTFLEWLWDESPLFVILLFASIFGTIYLMTWITRKATKSQKSDREK